jgi:hypothetical protein
LHRAQVKQCRKTEDVRILADLAEASSRVALRTSGSTEILSILPAEQRIASNRTVSPFSEITVAEWVQNRIKEGTLDDFAAAIQVDPANARLAAHSGRRLADYTLKKGADPDEARRARAEADLQTRRALKLAPKSDEVKTLRAEVATRLQLSSE